MDDKNFTAKHGSDPLWSAMGTYLKTRETAYTYLQARKKAGGSASIESRENADLKEALETVVTKLSKDSPKFMTTYSRYFSNDTLEYGGKVLK
jgi:hypothetical protein